MALSFLMKDISSVRANANSGMKYSFRGFSAKRIVCLSAILPDGEELNDLTAWIRSDAEGAAIKRIGGRPASASGSLPGQDRVRA